MHVHTKQKKSNIEMQNQRSRACDGICYSKGCSGANQIVLEVEVQKRESEYHQVQKSKDDNEESSVAFIHHPDVKSFFQCKIPRRLSAHLARHQHSCPR